MTTLPISRRWLLAALLALAVPATSLAGKGKPGGGGEEPPPEPVDPGMRFAIEYFSVLDNRTFSLWDANNAGQVVGGYQMDDLDWRGYVYDVSWGTGEAVDLNAITAGIPPGYVIRVAHGINASGQIAVYLDSDESLEGVYLSAGMVDLNYIDADGNWQPQFYLVPSPDGRQLAAVDINDQGDLLIRTAEASPYSLLIYNFGVIEPAHATPEPMDLGVSTTNIHSNFINNRTLLGGPQVVGAVSGPFPWIPFRLTVGGTYKEFPPFDDSNGNTIELGLPQGLNNFGDFCGGADIRYPKKVGRSTGEDASYVQGASTALYGHLGWAESINDAGDFVTDSGILHRVDAEAIAVADWLDPTDDDFAKFGAGTYFGGEHVSDRIFPDSDFPVIFGRHTDAEGINEGVVLIPVPVLESN